MCKVSAVHESFAIKSGYNDTLCGCTHSYPVLSSVGLKLLDLTHEISQTLTCFFVLEEVLLRVPAIKLHLLMIHTHILAKKVYKLVSKYIT